MYKFFVKSEQINGENINISGTDVNHIINVLRLKKGEEIQICNIDKGDNYISKIDEYNNEKVICNIISKIESEVESNIEIDLYQGLPKSDKMELIIQKTVEIGVKNIIPVSTIRTIVKLDRKDEMKKIERWQKISEVAAKQSKRDIIPNVGKKIDIKQMAEKIKEYDIFLVAYEEEKETNLKYILKKIKIGIEKNISVGVFVGPEGGIDEKEIEILIQNGAKIVTLGNRILRTETAPIVLISNIIYELED